MGDHKRSEKTELPERLRPVTEGMTRGSSSSNDVSPAEVATSTSSNTAHLQTNQEESTSYSLISPKDPNCAVCRRTKVTRLPCRRNPGDRADRIQIVEKFGDMITGHHKVLNAEQESRLHHKCVVVVQDLATQWNHSYPCKTKSAQETQRTLRKFSRPEENPKSICTDNSLEWSEPVEELNWNHERSTPRRSGIAERAVRLVKEGTSSVLVQLGLQESWWAEAMECYCFLRNVQDLPRGGQTPHERRFNSAFEGPIILERAELKFFPISAKDQGRVHQFGRRVLPGIFIGGLVIF